MKELWGVWLKYVIMRVGNMCFYENKSLSSSPKSSSSYDFPVFYVCFYDIKIVLEVYKRKMFSLLVFFEVFFVISF